MLRKQLAKEDNRHILKTIKILDDELIGLLSGRFNEENYSVDFDIKGIDNYGEKIEELQPVKIEELEVIESDFRRFKAEKKEETEIVKPYLDETETKNEPQAGKEETRVMQPDYSNFQLKKDKIEVIDTKIDRSEGDSEVRRILIEQPATPLESAKVSDTSEDMDDLGHAEFDANQYSRNYISKEIKLIKSLTDKLAKDNKNSNKDASLPEATADKTALPALNDEKSKAASETFPYQDEEPRKPRNEARIEPPSASPKENRLLMDEFQYETSEEDSMGIPFDAFDLSDFKLEDILNDEDDEPSDDILNDEELLRELYGDGEIREGGNSKGVEAMKDIDVVGGERFEKTGGILKKEKAPLQSWKGKSSDKLSTDFHEKLNAIIEETVTETIENSLNDLLPGIIEKVIHKKFTG